MRVLIAANRSPPGARTFSQAGLRRLSFGVLLAIAGAPYPRDSLLSTSGWPRLGSALQCRFFWRGAPEFGKENAVRFLTAIVVSLLVFPAAVEARAPSVLLIGDSNMYGFLGKELQALLTDRGFRVARRGKPTSGLARPDFFDWDTEARRLIELHDPDTVVWIVGGNDGQNLQPRAAGEGATIGWKREPLWRHEYARRLSEVAGILSSGGRKLILLSPTNRRPRLASEKMRRIIDVQRKTAAQLSRVHFVDLYRMTSQPDGRYQRWMRGGHGEVLLLRKGDGIHLTEAGAKELATRLLVVLDNVGLAMCAPLDGRLPSASDEPPSQFTFRR